MSGMAEVLAAHQKVSMGMTYGSPDGCRCGEKVYPERGDAEVTLRRDVAFAAHQAAALAAAGFGSVKEAAAAGVRSIFDIWGAGGRRTVRMEELHKADPTILSGEWDDHIKWNMGDIAKERAAELRAARA